MPLNSEIIIAASDGDEIALQQVLKYYDHHITIMATKAYTDEYGIKRKRINEDTKVTLQSELVMGLLKFSTDKAILEWVDSRK